MNINEKRNKVKKKMYKMGYDSTNPAYKFRVRDIYEDLTHADLDQLEKFADKIFAKVGIDVQFTRHFLDRANDTRNGKPITNAELTRLFKQEFKKWGKPIARLGPDQEAVMKDLATDINVPFALVWDEKNQELDLIAKTVMRKKDFKTPNQEFPVEGEMIPNPKNTIAIRTQSDGDFYNLSKYMGDLDKATKTSFNKPDTAAIISFYDPRELELVLRRIKKYTGLDAKDVSGMIDPGKIDWSIGRLMDSVNFYGALAEKSNSGSEEDIRDMDPAVKALMQKARAFFPQANTDLEAFIKYMQVDQRNDDREIDTVEKSVDSIEKTVADLETRIKKIEKSNKTESTELLRNIAEKWSQKYKDSIDCSNPKGFSQKAHCAGRKKNESAGVGIVTKQNATKDVPVGGEYMNIKKMFPGQKRPVPLTGKVKKKDK